MKPTDFRQISLEVGQDICLVGDDASSDWTSRGLVPVKIERFLVVERHHHWDVDKTPDWDAAAIVEVMRSFPSHLELPDNRHFIGQKLMLILRYPDHHWNSHDPVVHVFAIRIPSMLQGDNILHAEWSQIMDWLASHANLLDLSITELSELARRIIDKYIANG